MFDLTQGSYSNVLLHPTADPRWYELWKYVAASHPDLHAQLDPLITNGTLLPAKTHSGHCRLDPEASHPPCGPGACGGYACFTLVQPKFAKKKRTKKGRGKIKRGGICTDCFCCLLTKARCPLRRWKLPSPGVTSPQVSAGLDKADGAAASASAIVVSEEEAAGNDADHHRAAAGPRTYDDQRYGPPPNWRPRSMYTSFEEKLHIRAYSLINKGTPQSLESSKHVLAIAADLAEIEKQYEPKLCPTLSSSPFSDPEAREVVFPPPSSPLTVRQVPLRRPLLNAVRSPRTPTRQRLHEGERAWWATSRANNSTKSPSPHVPAPPKGLLQSMQALSSNRSGQSGNAS